MEKRDKIIVDVAEDDDNVQCEIDQIIDIPDVAEVLLKRRSIFDLRVFLHDLVCNEHHANANERCVDDDKYYTRIILIAIIQCIHDPIQHEN